MMFKILAAERICREGIDILNKHLSCHVDIMLKLSSAELLECIDQYDAILIRSTTKVNSELLRKGKKLKVIGRFGVGLDNIDLSTAEELGIKVLNVENESSISVAEHTIGLILALARHIPQAHQSLHKHLWTREKFIGVEIFNKTLGIIGLGKIGYEVFQRAKAFGMNVLVHDPFYTPEKAESLLVHLMPLEKLLAESDFITVHVPKTHKTVDLISLAEFHLCKKGVRIINTARGGIINELALLQCLREGIVAGAALDVFENEPDFNKQFLEFPQVILTPHIAASTQEAQMRIAITLAKKIVDTLCETNNFC